MLSLPDYKEQIRGDPKTNMVLLNALQGLCAMQEHQEFWNSRLTVTERSDNNVSTSVTFRKAGRSK